MNISYVDDEFIQNVVEKYSDMILRITYQNLKIQADSEDVVQNVFIKLINQPKFKDEAHMKAWLIRVTINLCKDFNKIAWYRKTEGLSDEKLIKSVELIYRTGAYDEVFMPYYKFLVELTSEKQKNGLKTFGAFYVPAIEGKYIENMPKWEGQFN